MLLADSQTTHLVDISPNAVKGSFKVRYPRIESNNEVSANLMDSEGRILDVEITINLTSEESVDITIANTESGIYHLKIFDGKTCVIKKIILQ